MRTFSLTFFIAFFTLLTLHAQSPSIELLERKLSTTDSSERLKVLDNLAEAYLETDNAKSVLYAMRAIQFVETENLKTEPQYLAGIYNTLGAAYFFENDFENSLKYYENEYQILRKTNLKVETALAQYNMAISAQKLNDFRSAAGYLDRGLEIAVAEKSIELQLQFYKARYMLYTAWNKNDIALQNLAKYTALRDIDFDSKYAEVKILRRNFNTNTHHLAVNDSAKALTKEDILQLENEFIKHEAQLSQTSDELNRLKTTRNRANFAFGFLIIAMLGAGVVVFYRNNLKFRRAKSQLEVQADLLEQATELISTKNTQIIESITYARRIQDSILIPEREIRKHLPDAFVFYQPKEIVSGDFYWFSKIEDEYVLAAIDCSGHGVPGAFMSMIGYSLLNEIVNEKRITKPDRVLKHLHIGVMAALQNAGSDSSADDGMDMSLCTINTRLKRFQFAGAKNHLYVLQGDKLKVLKANLHTVGGRPLRDDIKVEFTSYDFMYDEKTSIYMLSDGYFDQFGGIEDTKFNSKRFKKLLIDNRHLPMIEQKEVIRQTLADWKGDREQVDDILVLGVKLD